MGKRTTRHPFTYPLEEHFPNMRALSMLEGGVLLVAEKDGKFYILSDNGTLADFIDEDDPQRNELVVVTEYDTEAERQVVIDEMAERMAKSEHIWPSLRSRSASARRTDPA